MNVPAPFRISGAEIVTDAPCLLFKEQKVKETLILTIHKKSLGRPDPESCLRSTSSLSLI